VCGVRGVRGADDEITLQDRIDDIAEIAIAVTSTPAAKAGRASLRSANRPAPPPDSVHHHGRRGTTLLRIYQTRHREFPGNINAVRQRCVRGIHRRLVTRRLFWNQTFAEGDRAVIRLLANADYPVPAGTADQRRLVQGIEGQQT
jgi:hypothetical protein